jgi:hypothetical protein
VLITVIVPHTWQLGEGAAGMGTAIALSTRELVIAGVFLGFLGKRAFDRRTIYSIGVSLIICVLVTVAHRAMKGIGPARLAVDALLYMVLAFVLRVYRIEEVRQVAHLIKSRGRG